MITGTLVDKTLTFQGVDRPALDRVMARIGARIDRDDSTGVGGTASGAGISSNFTFDPAKGELIVLVHSKPFIITMKRIYSEALGALEATA